MTLIEMVAVMALMGFLITMGVLAFHSWTRAGGVRTAQPMVLGGLASARQLALTHRGLSRFSAYNLGGHDNRGAFSLYLATNTISSLADARFRLIGATNRLPRGVTFVNHSDNPFVLYFRPDGTGGGDDDLWSTAYQRHLIFGDHRPRGLTTTVVVHRLTGFAHIEPAE